MQKIVPNIWCQGNADEVGNFYAATFPDTSMEVSASYPKTNLPDFQQALAGQPLVLSMLDPSRVAPAPGVTSAGESEHIAPTGAWGFLREGIRHILTGYDHVLFLLCLLLPSVMQRTPQGWRPVVFIL